jgi:hypothetical protein
MVEDGELQAQKWYDSKLLLTAPQSHAHIVSYPRAACGHPQSIKSHCDPERRQLMKIEMVFETSAHSINGRHGEPNCGD